MLSRFVTLCVVVALKCLLLCFCRQIVFDMAERPEDLNLPNSVVSKIIKEAVCTFCSHLQ